MTEDIQPALNLGERTIENAPYLVLRNGQSCVPQHYLQYSHSLHSVEALIQNIEFDPSYPIFISEDSGGIILQVGIIGHDNYKKAGAHPPRKIVFGRKWRVEPNLPSSEIIQTAFLAIKKAREHEIRELFTLQIGSKTTTPFNNHHDLPLMARNKDILEDSEIDTHSLTAAFNHIKFDQGLFSLLDIQTLRNDMTVLTLNFEPRVRGDYPELTETPLTLLLNKLTANELYHSLFSEILTRSNRYVDETFTYQGFARFSRNVDVTAIAQLSADIRQKPKSLLAGSGKGDAFIQSFDEERYDTDITRVPQLSGTAYSQKLREHLSAMELSNFDMLLQGQAAT